MAAGSTLTSTAAIAPRWRNCLRFTYHLHSKCLPLPFVTDENSASCYHLIWGIGVTEILLDPFNESAWNPSVCEHFHINLFCSIQLKVLRLRTNENGLPSTYAENIGSNVLLPQSMENRYVLTANLFHRISGTLCPPRTRRYHRKRSTHASRATRSTPRITPQSQSGRRCLPALYRYRSYAIRHPFGRIVRVANHLLTP